MPDVSHDVLLSKDIQRPRSTRLDTLVTPSPGSHPRRSGRDGTLAVRPGCRVRLAGAPLWMSAFSPTKIPLLYGVSRRRERHKMNDLSVHHQAAADNRVAGDPHVLANAHRREAVSGRLLQPGRVCRQSGGEV